MASHPDGADRDIDTVVVGTEVYASDGGKVGVVGEVGTDYVLVERGLLSTTKIHMDSAGVVHLRIPMSQAIAGEA